MHRSLALAAVLVAALATAGCVAPPQLPAPTDPAPSSTAPDGGVPSADAEGPVWPANMASYGVIFTADGVLETPVAGAQREDVEVEVPHAILYVDFLCPHCGTFTRTHAAELREAIDAGEIALELRPMAFLDDQSTDEYSTRASNAFAAVVDEFPESAWDFYLALFDQQPASGTSGLTNGQLIELAASVGAASEQLSHRIETVALRDFTATANDAGLSEPITAGGPTLTGTPSLFLDGEHFEGANDEPGAVAEFLADRT